MRGSGTAFVSETKKVVISQHVTNIHHVTTSGHNIRRVVIGERSAGAADRIVTTMKYQSAFILISAIGALARPAQDVLGISKPRPLVIWHGLGPSVPFPSIIRFACR